MAKSKLQKREEALQRQRQRLITRDIKDWRAAANKDKFYDAEHESIMYERVVSSAYTAHCDRHGNYLDERYYKNRWRFDSSTDAHELALHQTLFSLQELKELTADCGTTLYKLAYGTPPVHL